MDRFLQIGHYAADRETGSIVCNRCYAARRDVAQGLNPQELRREVEAFQRQHGVARCEPPAGATWIAPSGESGTHAAYPLLTPEQRQGCRGQFIPENWAQLQDAYYAEQDAKRGADS